MDERQLQSISLKVLVDKEKNQVVFAESDSEFVDILFSFLTMPIGTIIRLTRSQPFAAEIGCMNNLYESVEKLDVQHLWTAACKTMLLCPRNSAENPCRNLKVNIDDKESIQYYTCSSATNAAAYLLRHTNHLISTYENIQCYCGQLMSRSIQLWKQNDEEHRRAFLNDVTLFMISDGLHVTPLSTMTSFSLLGKLGIKDWSAVEERTVNVEVDVHALAGYFKLENARKNLLMTTLFFRQGRSTLCD